MSDHKTDDFRCPCCGEGISTVMALPDFGMVHWILNPSLAINELVLGQCVAARVYLCESCPGPKQERAYVRCQSCGRYHSGMIWSGRLAFKNWIGHVCPDCGGSIPRLRNVFSALILAATAPLWGLPYLACRDRWRAWQQERTRAWRDQRAAEEPPPVNWIRSGLKVGLTAWLIAAVAILVGAGVSLRALAIIPILLPVMLGLGWVWGRYMSWSLNRREVTIVKQPEPIRPRVSAPGRCPYCRTAADEDEAVACTRCMARHHEACWDEHKQCASCENPTRFAGVEETAGRPPRRRREKIAERSKVTPKV